MWRRAETVALAFLGFSLAAAAAVAVWAAFIRVTPFDPIEFAPQTVERLTGDGSLVVPLIDGYDGPAVRLGDTVPVHAELIVNADAPVEVVGSVVWISVEPPGLECAEVDAVPRVIEPGVLVFNFENDIPDCVQVFMSDDVPRRWRITGTATPTAPGGVASVWSTEPFWLVP